MALSGKCFNSRLAIITILISIIWACADCQSSDSIVCSTQEAVGAFPGLASLTRSQIKSANENCNTLDSEKEKILRDLFLGNVKKSDGEMVAVNVESFGAIGDGVTDDTQAFVSAWEIACSMSNAVFLVPEGKRYIVKPVRLKGPCSQDGTDLIIQIAGTVVAPNDPTTWDPDNPTKWLVFSKLNGTTIQGGGIIDGSGQKWWEQSCKINTTNPCKSAPTALTVDSSSNVRLRNLRFQNSQQMHIVIARSIGVELTNLQLVAPSNSPNTDGIHITASQNVVVEGCSIATGDDCISIVSGSSNVKIKEIVCGPGHGISIGSLGKDNSEAYVSGVVVDGAMLTGTTNGLRIKTWQGGSGFAHGIRFQNVLMNNVANPIIIDQFYCDSSKPCQNKTSAVRVGEVMYINVKGSSKTPEAMKFACSDSVPCQNIILNNVDIQRESGESANYSCSNAIGFRLGAVNPSVDCLQCLTSKEDDGCKGGSGSGNDSQPTLPLDCYYPMFPFT